MASVLTACAVGAGALASSANADPPPGRAYELVSPVDDPSGSIAGLASSLTPAPGLASVDGDRLLYGSVSGLGTPWSGVTNGMNFGRRTANGWRTTTATVSLDRGNTPTEIVNSEPRNGWLSPDGRSYTFWASNLGAVPLVGQRKLNGVFRATDDGAPPAWLSRPIDGIVPIPFPDAGYNVIDNISGSRDGTTVAFQAEQPLVAGAPDRGVGAIYASRAGQIELASRDSGGAAMQVYAKLECVGVTQNVPAIMSGFCSSLAGGGRYVLFRIDGQGHGQGHYVRDLEQQETRLLSGVSGGNILAAAADGDRAYFAVGGTMQEADLATGDVVARPAITGQPVGLSADGRKMLFLEAPSAGNGNSRTLRYWDGATAPGSSVRVGTVGTTPPVADLPPQAPLQVYRSQDAGRTWIFSAAGSLDPVRPNATPGTLQLYRWTVGGAAPRCLSCEPVDGVARTTGINLTVQEVERTESLLNPTVTDGGEGTWGALMFSASAVSQPGHSVSDDGRLILFDSPDRLVEGDRNVVRDVYLWDRDAPEGKQLALVTSGEGNTPSYALDLDPTGRNAFFSTREGLVPADRNGSFDVYVARVGGGFPQSPESCTGETCRPPVIPAPLDPAVGSELLTTPSKGAEKPVQAGMPKLRVRAVRTTPRRLTIRVDAPRTGRLRVTGKAVRTTSRSVKRAATYTLRVPLSAGTQRQVARGRSVKVGLRVAFTPTGAKKASVVRTTVTVKKGR